MTEDLTDRILQGEVRAASRLMRRIDDDLPGARAEVDALFPHTGDATIVGVTGYPGTGKSTLVDGLIGRVRDRDQTVACIAIDPSSPNTGGAILGDRVRMKRHALDDGVFVRSVATRGKVGGLSRSTPAFVQILDAMGFDVVLIETVGVGQDEVDVVRLADTNIVVMVPGLGDDIQATKAGILEIADVFALNKSDRPGARKLKQELRSMLRIGSDVAPPDSPNAQTWEPPLVPTVATEGEGLDSLLESLDEHRDWLEASGEAEARRRRRVEELMRLVLGGEFDARLEGMLDTDLWDRRVAALMEGDRAPYETADELLNRMFAED